MEKKIEYSILKYSPSLISGESINLGLVVSAIDQPLFTFVSTKKLARVKEFDDTIDLDVLKSLLSSIKEELSTTLENYNSRLDVASFIQFYVNEYHFSRVIQINYDDFDKAVNELMRLYLRYDFAKSQRPSHTDELRFMTRILETNRVRFSRNVREIGNYSERITYDFKIDRYGIKLFWLRGKDLSRLVNDIKAWAWNAEHSSTDIETVIVYDADEDSTNPLLETIVRILKSSPAKVFAWEEGMQWLGKISAQN